MFLGTTYHLYTIAANPCADQRERSPQQKRETFAKKKKTKKKQVVNLNLNGRNPGKALGSPAGSLEQLRDEKKTDGKGKKLFVRSTDRKGTETYSLYRWCVLLAVLESGFFSLLVRTVCSHMIPILLVTIYFCATND